MPDVPRPRRLIDDVPHLARILSRNIIRTPLRYAVSDIRCEVVRIAMRDGVKLATDLYLPPGLPAPVVVVRTPYGRGGDTLAGVLLSFARRGYVAVSQDCRGTGASEPESWDYYMHESEDGYDFVDWVRRQEWCDGFIGSCGGSYVGQTQWPMSMHPAMSTIAPEVSGLGPAVNTARLHMFCNAFSRSVGKGGDKVPFSVEDLEEQILDETLSTGYFNEPLHAPFSNALLERFPRLRNMPPAPAKRWLWEQYCSMSCAERAELVKAALGTRSVTIVEVEALRELFGHKVSHDAHTLPCVEPAELYGALNAPALMITGWYDWGLNDALATWTRLMSYASEPVRARSRLLIAPNAHNTLGYHEAIERHPELQHNHRTPNNVELLLRWFEAVRRDEIADWPSVVYYLMGANQWCVADAWPPPGTQQNRLYLAAAGRLTADPPEFSPPDRYVYDPENPTPTVGGSIVSYVYPPGSVDVQTVQQRADVLTYTSAPLDGDIDVVGPMSLVVFVRSSARDTDFVGRVTDVFPDGRAIQLQAGILRTRYRDVRGDPSWLEPGRIFRLEIDLWATANRFRRGHSIRVDISSADFPRFDRNSNLAGETGRAVAAEQAIYHDPEHASHLLFSAYPGM